MQLRPDTIVQLEVHVTAGSGAMFKSQLGHITFVESERLDMTITVLTGL